MLAGTLRQAADSTDSTDDALNKIMVRGLGRQHPGEHIHPYLIRVVLLLVLWATPESQCRVGGGQRRSRDGSALGRATGQWVT